MRRLVLLCAFALPAAANLILVPSQQPTIQAGLNAAQVSDTVLVAPDTYQEQLSWPSIDGVTLLSEAGPESTIVDAQHAGICLEMTSGSLTRRTVVCGFTFANGLDQGIRCLGSPTIIGNRVTGCLGVGVFLSSSSPSFNPLLKGNEIDGCRNEEEGWNYGAGVYVNASNAAARPELCHNHIHHDTLINSARNYGGGIYCGAEALIYQNVIEANVLTCDTGTTCRAYGGGIFVASNKKPLIFCNLIVGNRCETDAWKYGAGIRTYLGAQPLIVNNTIADNVCTGPHMWSNGGGIYTDMRCTTYVKNNVVANNQATTGSGIYCNTSQGGTVISLHNDYWNNVLAGCSMGTGDIAQDPLFVSGDNPGYFLSQEAAGQPSTSPCVDAGDTLLLNDPVKLDSLLHAWTTRTDSIVDVEQTDMGYHYPSGVMTGVGEPPVFREALRPLSASPSLFVSRTVLRAAPYDRVCVFDRTGREVRVLTADGNGEATWHGVDTEGSELAAGVYLARATGHRPKTLLKLR